jgi:hypothetical protein
MSLKPEPEAFIIGLITGAIVSSLLIALINEFLT